MDALQHGISVPKWRPQKAGRLANFQLRAAPSFNQGSAGQGGSLLKIWGKIDFEFRMAGDMVNSVCFGAYFPNALPVD
ncbi:MAG: hypothetical protein R3C55_04835 [Parvularculaceae bacterium]